MLIKNGYVYTMHNDECGIMDIRIEDGKFVEVGKLEANDNEEVIDASGKNVYPGFVEAHCHLGMEESSIRGEGDDVNEMSHPLTPHVRGIDGCYPLDETLKEAREAGVTCVATGPGSANVLGGTFFAMKTYGTSVDEMSIKNPVAMKSAFGENPKRVYHDSHIVSRMNIAALMRETLFKTKEYMAKKEAANGDASKMPAFDMKLEAMIPVLKKELVMKCHAHRSDDILTAIRIAKEFDINISLDHCTDGQVILPQIKASGFPAIIGPSLGHKSKYELKSKSFKTPKAFDEAGVLFALTTDSPVIPQMYLPMCAGLAHKEGLNHLSALKAITINPAKILGLDERIGSIEVGKDADLVIVDGDVLDSLSNVETVFINGVKVK